MNNLIHTYLNQLRVISLFKEGDKGKIENGFLTIDNKSWVSWIKRQKWLYPWSLDINSKEETVKYLQNFYVSISQSIDQILIELNFNQNNQSSKNDKLLLISVSLLDNIISSISGLQNLSNTYKNYPRQYAEIKGIIDDYANPIIQLLEKNIPKDKLELFREKKKINENSLNGLNSLNILNELKGINDLNNLNNLQELHIN